VISALSISYFNLIYPIGVKPKQIEGEEGFAFARGRKTERATLLGPSEQPSVTEKISSFAEYFEEFMRSLIARRIDRRCGYRLWDLLREHGFQSMQPPNIFNPVLSAGTRESQTTV